MWDITKLFISKAIITSLEHVIITHLICGLLRCVLHETVSGNDTKLNRDSVLDSSNCAEQQKHNLLQAVYYLPDSTDMVTVQDLLNTLAQRQERILYLEKRVKMLFTEAATLYGRINSRTEKLAFAAAHETRMSFEVRPKVEAMINLGSSPDQAHVRQFSFETAPPTMVLPSPPHTLTNNHTRRKRKQNQKIPLRLPPTPKLSSAIVKSRSKQSNKRTSSTITQSLTLKDKAFSQLRQCFSKLNIF